MQTCTDFRAPDASDIKETAPYRVVVGDKTFEFYKDQVERLGLLSPLHPQCSQEWRQNSTTIQGISAEIFNHVHGFILSGKTPIYYPNPGDREALHSFAEKHLLSDLAKGTKPFTLRPQVFASTVREEAMLPPGEGFVYIDLPGARATITVTIRKTDEVWVRLYVRIGEILTHHDTDTKSWYEARLGRMHLHDATTGISYFINVIDRVYQLNRTYFSAHPNGAARAQELINNLTKMLPDITKWVNQYVDDPTLAPVCLTKDELPGYGVQQALIGGVITQISGSRENPQIFFPSF